MLKNAREEQIDQAYGEILHLLGRRQLREAYRQLLIFLNEGGEWSLSVRVEQLQTTYNYMLQYMRQGLNDPERNRLYTRLLAETYEITDQAYLHMLGTVSTLHYISLRNKYLTPDGISRLSLEHLSSRLKAVDKHDYPALQQARNDLFLSVYANSNWTEAEAAHAADLLLDVDLPSADLCLLTSAVTLSLTECFDIRKTAFLIEAYTSPDVEVSTRALVGLAITVLCYPRRLELYPHVMSRLNEVGNNLPLPDDLNQVYLQLLMSRETEKVERQLREEIIPGMLKQMKDLRDKKLDLESLSADDPNPDWLQSLEGSEVGRTMREMEQLQSEGADICIGTFAQMKGYPFFSDLCNWVLPFDIHHPALPEAVSKPGSDVNALLTLLLTTEVMCNSDKYSVCFMLSRTTEGERNAMISQMLPPDANLSAVDSLIAQAQDQRSATPRATIVRQYVQDLYRLFKLGPSHNEMTTIFDMDIALHRLPPFSPMLTRRDLLAAVADFLLRKARYVPLLDVCRKISTLDPTDADAYRKQGYCQQQFRRYSDAIEAYRKADLLEPDHAWTLRRLAACYRHAADYPAAIACYDRLLSLQPDNRQALLLRGGCLVESGQYAQALQCFFQADLLSEGDPRTWRAIGWCAFLMGKLDVAARYYDKLTAGAATATDYLNAGHVALSQGLISTAVSHYQRSIDLSDRDTFLKAFNADRPTLIDAGIKPEDIPLILDMIDNGEASSQ